MRNRYIAARKTINLKWIGIDLDGVIAESIWPKQGIGELIKGTKETMDELVGMGYKIIIFTARPSNDYEAIERYCKDHHLPVKEIVCGKMLLRVMVDDKAVGFRGDWKKAMKEIKKLL